MRGRYRVWNDISVLMSWSGRRLRDASVEMIVRNYRSEVRSGAGPSSDRCVISLPVEFEVFTPARTDSPSWSPRDHEA